MEKDDFSTSDGATTPSMYESYTAAAVKGKSLSMGASNTMRVINTCIGSVGLVGNMFVLLVLNLTPMRKKRTSIYLVNQSAIDALGSLLLVATSWLEDDGRHYASVADEIFCRVWVSKSPLWAMMLASSYNLVVLTVERYLAIVHPMWHKVEFTTGKVHVSIGVVWVLGICTPLGAHLPASRITADGACIVHRWKIPVAGTIVVLLVDTMAFFAPLAIFIYCYSRMARVLLRSVRVAPVNAVAPSAATGTGASVGKPEEGGPSCSTANEASKASKEVVAHCPATITTRASKQATAATINPASSQATADDKHAKARRNVFTTLVTVALVYCICWSWNVCYYTLSTLGLPYPYIDFTGSFYSFTVVMVFCNCCVNPLIYTARYKEFQQAAKSLFYKATALANRI